MRFSMKCCINDVNFIILLLLRTELFKFEIQKYGQILCVHKPYFLMPGHISWNHCGHNDVSYSNEWIEYSNTNFDEHFFLYHSFGISFIFCANISLISCTFKNSMIDINNAISGAVCIDQIHFLSTDISYWPEYWATAPLPYGLIMHQDIQTKLNNNVVVKINNTLFSQVNSTIYGRALLLLYILVDDPNSIIQVFVDQSNFSSVTFNPGWLAENGMVWIRILSCKDAYIKFSEVKFNLTRLNLNLHIITILPHYFILISQPLEYLGLLAEL